MLNKNVEVFMGCDTGLCTLPPPCCLARPLIPPPPTAPAPALAAGPSAASPTASRATAPTRTATCWTAMWSISVTSSCASATLRPLWRASTQQTRRILASHKRPFMLGGEHLVTLGAFRAVAEKFPDVHIIHFDAHADLRDDYLGVPLSHACVMRRCWELVGNGRIFQFGIRSGDREEFSWGRTHVRTNRFNFDTLEEVVEQLQGKPVYFTLDLDVLDPSVFPGTGTPEPGGVSFEELRKAATLVCSKLRIVGCDVNELSPHYDQSGVSTIVACKIVREMLLAFQK